MLMFRIDYHTHKSIRSTGRSVTTRQRMSDEVGYVLSVPTIRDVSAAQVGSLGHAKESTELAEGSLGESLREEICYVHISGNIANSE